MPAQSKRDISIDIARGFAIFFMIAANMALDWNHQPNYAIRLLYSLAAPTFVILAGAMIARAVITQSRHGLYYFLQRGLFLIMAGALSDMVAYHFIPFLSVDVLYLIGLTTPFLFLTARQTTRTVFMITISVFALTFIGQNWLGYVELPTQITLGNSIHASLQTITKHWLIDGWFPFFPWFAFGTTGILLAQLRWNQNKTQRFNTSSIFLTALAGTLGGLILMNYFPGPQYIRDGYQELFYPVTPGFALCFISFAFCLIALIDATQEFKIWNLFQPLGEASLFVYLAHAIMIGKIYTPYLSPMDTNAYLFWFFSLFTLLFILSYSLRGVRKRYPQMPTQLKWVLG